MYHLKATPSYVLFHITGINAAASILKTGSFSLTPTEGTEAEQSISGAKFYLSTARNPHSQYVLHDASKFSVLFVLDGRKLAQKYKAEPVHYWNDSGDSVNRQEQEDRIYSRTSKIPSLPYIKAVRVMTTHGNDKVLFEIYRVCKYNKIPVLFFDKTANLLTGRNPVEYKPAKAALPEPESAYVIKRGRGSYVHGWLNLWRVNLAGRSPHQAAKADSNLESAYRRLPYSDAIRQINADMHNAKMALHGARSKEREALDALVGIMRKNKLTTEQFLDLMRAKWYPKR